MTKATMLDNAYVARGLQLPQSDTRNLNSCTPEIGKDVSIFTPDARDSEKCKQAPSLKTRMSALNKTPLSIRWRSCGRLLGGEDSSPASYSLSQPFAAGQAGCCVFVRRSKPRRSFGGSGRDPRVR